ncbi:ABC transporter permease [Frondihabitans australicus]|uniref:Peptide/nickel transport system permease protein n=1 Tax=Frondihabitans australicus TaxID=386892 RepID=A0A495IIM2_9MICO|nr:ABC transporter permease [Frondihabitans australicus]RKR75882.1 peptide/nickel transport system permease protein [Frondihabitans australicus]
MTAPSIGLPRLIRPARARSGSPSRSWSLWVGVGLLGLLIASGIVAIFWTPYAPGASAVGPLSSPPSLAHPFGTDDLGGDVLSRTMAAATTDVSITVVVVLLALIVGTLWGSLAGFFGGVFDYVTMRVLELLNSFPSLLLAVLVIAVAGPGIVNVVFVVAVLPLPDYVRLARAEVSSKKQWQFADAARLVGRGPFGVLFAHVVPNSLRPLLTFASVNASYVVSTVGALGYLGLGIQPGSAEWGSMIAKGQDAILSGQWWISGFPGLAIFLLAAAFHLISDAVADARDEGSAA